MDGGGRRRARSQHVRPENPLLTPITEEERQLARLRGSILIAEREKEKERGHQRANLQESGGWQGTALSRIQGALSACMRFQGTSIGSSEKDGG